MNTPKDQFNLIGIYFNIQQYEKATELLEAGLKNGTVENTEKNWELLAYSFQQIRREFKAIEALKEATRLFPENGQLHYQLAQLYYGLNKNQDALRHLRLSAERGGGDKPPQTYLFLAYVAYELKDYDEAKRAVELAAEYPDVADEVARMRKAIQDSEAERKYQLEGASRS